MKEVFVTVTVRDSKPINGAGWLEPGRSVWTHLLIDEDDPNFDRIVGDTAKLNGQKALLGRLRPTPRTEGGRG